MLKKLKRFFSGKDSSNVRDESQKSTQVSTTSTNSAPAVKEQSPNHDSAPVVMEVPTEVMESRLDSVELEESTDEVDDFLQSILDGNAAALRKQLAEHRILNAAGGSAASPPTTQTAISEPPNSAATAASAAVAMSSPSETATNAAAVTDGAAQAPTVREDSSSPDRRRHPASRPAYRSSAARSLADYELVAYLGKGTFAEVTLARHKRTLDLFAIKKIEKLKVKQEGCVERTFTERQVLSSLRHPFLVTLQQAFQSGKCLYFVLEFAQGGDLYNFSTEKLWSREMRRTLRKLRYPYYGDGSTVGQNAGEVAGVTGGDGRDVEISTGRSRYYLQLQPSGTSGTTNASFASVDGRGGDGMGGGEVDGAHPPSFVLSFHKDDRRLRHARRSMRHLHTRGASNISSTAPLLHYSSSAVLPTESPQSTMMGEEDQSTGRQDRASTTDDGGESQLLTHRTIEEAFHHSPRSHAELILRGYSLDTLFGPNSGYSPALEERGEENASPLTVVALSQLQQRQQEADTHSATAETASTLPQASTSGVPPTAPSRDPSEEGCPGLQTVLRVPADAEQASPQVRVPQGLSSNPTSRRGGEEGPANINNTNNKNNNTRPTMARQALRLNSPIDRPAPTSSMIEGGETASQPLTTSRSTDSKRPPALFTQSTQSLGLSTSRVESASVHIPDAAPDDARLPIRLVAFYAVEIALVLEYIHQSGFIYRDLKPENILMKRDGHVMLTDFGVAKSRKGAAIAASSGGGDTTEEKVPSPTVERAASFTGTAQYMSPEMLLGTSHDCATDWWSFGCLLFEWANGRKPFDDPNQLKLFRSIVEEDVVVSPHDFKLVALEVHLRITQLYLRYQELFTPLLSPLDVNAAASPGGAGNPSFSHPSDSLLPSMRNALSTSGFHERADLSMPGQTPRNVSFRLNVGADGGMMMFPQHQWHSTENLPVAERDVFLHHAMSELEEARDLLRDLILQLLQRQPQKRLCGADVLEHPFFSCRYVAAELYDQMVLFNPPRQWASAASSPSVSYQRISTEATADFDSITNLGLSHSARRCSARRPFQGDDVREESSMPVADVVGADASNFPMGHFTAEDFLELSPTPRPPDWRERFTQLKINPLYVPRLRAPDDLRFFPDAVTATGVNAALEQHRKLRAAKEEQFERLQSILTAGTCGSARTPLQSRSVVLLSTDEGDVASTSTPLPSARPHRSRRRGDEGTSSTSGNLSSPEKGSSNRRRGGRRGSSAALSCVQSTTAAGGGPSSACMSAAISTAKEDELLSSPIMLPARVPQPSKYKSSSRASSLLSSDFGVEERATDEARNTQAEKLVPHLPIPQLPSILRNAAAPTTSGGGRDGEEDDDLLAKTAVLPAEFLTAALATIAAQRQKEELNAASAPAKLTDPTTDLRNTAESARSAMDDTRSTPSTELDGLSATRAPMHDGQASEALAKASHRPNTYYEDDALEEGVSLFASMPATARRPNQPVDTSMELSLSATGHSVTTEHLTSPCAAEAAHVDPTRLPSSAQVLSSPMEGSTPTGSMVEFMSGTTPQSPQPITSSESNRMLSPSTSEGAESGESGAMQRYRSPSPAAGLYDERHPLCGSLLSEPNPITRENTIIQDELMSNDSLHFRSRSSLSSLRHSHAGAEALPLFFRAQADAVDDLSPALATDERSTTNCFVREEGCPSSGRGSTRSGDGRAHSPTIRVLSMATAEEDGRQTGDEYQRQAASESSTTDDGSTTSTTSDSAMILVTNGSMISSNGSFALGTPMMMEHPMMAFAERHLPDAAVASHMGRSLSEPGTGASPRYRNRSFHHHSVVAITDSGPMELSATNVIPSMTLHGVAYDVDDGPTYAQGNRSRRCFSESSISHTPADRSRGVERARPGAHFPSTTQSPLQQPPPGVGTAEARAMEASPLEVKSMRSAVHQRLMASRTGARVTSLLGSGHGGPTREGANVHVPVLHSTSPAGRRPTSPQSATSFGSPREANHSAFSCVDTRQPPSAIRTSGGDPLDVTSPTTDRPSSSRVGMSNDFYNFSYRTGSPADGDSTDHVLGEERYPLPLSTNAAQGRHSNDGSPTSRPSAGGPSLYNEMSLSNFEHFSNFSFAVQPQGSMCFDVGSPPT